MNRYQVHHYNRPAQIDRTFVVEAESAFDALVRADVGMPAGNADTTSHDMMDVWRRDAGDAAEMAAADNRHWQLNPHFGTIGAAAWRIA